MTKIQAVFAFVIGKHGMGAFRPGKTVCSLVPYMISGLLILWKVWYNEKNNNLSPIEYEHRIGRAIGVQRFFRLNRGGIAHEFAAHEICGGDCQDQLHQ